MTMVVHRTKVILSGSKPLDGRFSIPVKRLGVILRYAISPFIHHSKSKLRTRIPLFCKRLEYCKCGFVIAD